MAHSLPLMPYVELSGEAGVVAGVFALAGAALLVAARRVRATAGAKRGAPGAAAAAGPSKATLLSMLESARTIAEKSTAAATAAVEAASARAALRARMGEAGEPATLASVVSAIDRDIAAADRDLFAATGIAEEEVAAALARLEGRDAEVAAAAAAVRCAHPLALPAATILAVQNEIADAEVEAHRQAVAAAAEAGVEDLGGTEFAAILRSKMRAAGARPTTRAGGGGESLTAAVLGARGMPAKAPLWTYIVSYAITQEAAAGGGDAFKRAFFGIMDRQKAALRAMGLEVG
jgi:hypothetical protein